MIFAPKLKHRVFSASVAHIDIFPTVCELLRIPKPHFLQGHSLVPLLSGKKGSDEPIYFESLSPFYNMGWAPIRGFIHKEQKFIDSPIPEIYDFKTDFHEKNNQATARSVATFREELERLIKRQSSSASLEAQRKADRETQEKLRSLGYVASLPGSPKKIFSPEEDAKTLLPYHNRAMEALDLWSAGKTREAVAELREIITAKKNISTAYLNLATLFRSEGKLNEAIAVLKAGLENLPENYDLFSQHLAMLYETGQFEETLRIFETAHFPQVEFDPIVWNYAGLARWKKGEFLKAKQCYEKSLAIDPEFAVPYYNLGTLHAFEFRRTGDSSLYQQAVKNYERAISLDPGYGAAYHGLGVVHFEGKDFAKAVQNLTQALKLDPGLDEALLLLGLAHLRGGNKEKALACFLRYKTTSSYELLSPTERARLEEYIVKSKQD